jgi:hypothetical protein
LGESLQLAFLCLLPIAYCQLFSFSQSPNWLWAKSAGGIGDDDGTSISTDVNGNVFVTGYFYSPSITFGTTTLTNADSTWNYADIFVAKLNGVVGIEEFVSEDLEVRIEPNPTSGKFRYSVLGNQDSVKEVKVYNLLGEVVYWFPVTAYRILNTETEYHRPFFSAQWNLFSASEN